MRRSTINLHTTLTCRAHETAERLRRDRERGSITLEYILWAVAIAALVGVAATALRGWIMGKVGELG